MPSENKRQSLNALAPGTVLRDYIIESELGSGGFSIVYLARHHLKAGWLYAIKEFLPGELAVRGRGGTRVHPVSTEAQGAFDDGLQRFRGEAEQLRKFRNERYIVSCQNYFEENGTAYLVMDYDDGLPLSEFLLRREAAGQPFTEADLLSVVEPLLEGLAVVHRADVLHRDIKPGNIFVRRRNDLVGRPAHPVLIDFGAAKQNYLARHSRSHAPYTPGYAAFEQVSSMGEIGPWTDIYAVGALMWRMVAGGCRPDDSRLLVPDESTGTPVCSPTPRAAEKRSYAVHRGQPDPMVPAVELGAGRFSRHLLEAIDGCLPLYPEDRVQSCRELRKLLRIPAPSADASSPQMVAASLFPSVLEEQREESIYIPSDVLRAAINGALGKGPGVSITPAEMATLTGLDASYSSDTGHSRILNLSGLDFATNLTWLDLHSNRISDVSVLSGLTNLTVLDLHSNQITDVSDLSSLTNLTVLDLHSNQITDVSDLSGLTNLTVLSLSSNQMSDVSDLSGLTNLTMLSLSSNQMSDVSVLSGLTNLTVLELNSNQITDVSVLSGLTNLTVLYLNSNRITDVSDLSGLTNLTKLSLHSNQITDVSELSGLTNLRGLDLHSNEISDISVLSGLTNLTVLYLHSNRITDVSVLSGLTNLTELYLHSNRISDVSGLSSLTNLTELGLNSNEISDVLSLSGLTNLTELDLHSNRISDVSGLLGLTNLTKLWLNSNDISDVSGLSSLTNLTVLLLYSNQISDVSGLSGLTNLTGLDLGDNYISDVSDLSGLTNLTWLGLHSNQILDVSPLSSLTNLTELYLNFNPLSQTSIETHIPALRARGVSVDY